MLEFCNSASSQVFTNLWSFTIHTNGQSPRGALVLSGDTLYGTTTVGGGVGFSGTIFKINTNGTGYVVLKRLSPIFGSGSADTNSDGGAPRAGLVLSGNTLYGSAPVGGIYGLGTVFKINTDGTGFFVLKHFIDGSSLNPLGPIAKLALSDNVLYGTTFKGGTWTNGTIFKLNTDGTGFAVLKNFSQGIYVSSIFRSTNGDGANPRGTLVVSGDTLYGTTSEFGPAGLGTIFKINTNGTGFTVLKYFTNSPDGAEPEGGLTLFGSTLYGTTGSGGTGTSGTIFKLNTDGTGFTILKNFTNNPDGAGPICDLVLSGNSLFGTTSYGTSSGCGTVFQVNTDGTSFKVFTNLSNTTGGNPESGLVLSGSTLYGTTQSGSSGYGAVYGLTLPIIPPNSSIFSIITTNGSLGFTNRQFRFTLAGPAGSNVVISASTNLQTWISLQTNSLSGGSLNFTDTLATNYLRRFYRANLQ